MAFSYQMHGVVTWKEWFSFSQVWLVKSSSVTFLAFLMCFRPSVVLCRVNSYYIAIKLVLLQIHIMARNTHLNKEEIQSIVTLINEGQSIWKISWTLNLSPSAVAKNDQTLWRNWPSWGKEDQELLHAFMWQTYFNICSEEIARVRPSWSNCAKETITLAE